MIRPQVNVQTKLESVACSLLGCIQELLLDLPDIESVQDINRFLEAFIGVYNCIITGEILIEERDIDALIAMLSDRERVFREGRG
jgi:hypothetical protein